MGHERDQRTAPIAYCMWPYDEMPHLAEKTGPVIGRLSPFAVDRHATFRQA